MELIQTATWPFQKIISPFSNFFDIFFNNSNNISKAIDLFIKNLRAFKKDINLKNNKSILKKLIQTKRVRSKIIKLRQDTNKPDFGRS